MQVRFTQTVQESLFPSQTELIKQGYLESNDNWLICAPTGAGKTLMGEWALLKSIENGHLAGYVAPLKAIVKEKQAEWSAKYPGVAIGLFTGDSTRASGKPSVSQLLLLTPEKLASYVQNWKRNLNWLSQLDVLVIDEFHVVGDSSRGAVLETLVGRLQRINPFLRIVALSATAQNFEEISSWLRARTFTTSWRPVPLERRVVRFRKVTEKFAILLSEVTQTVRKGGKVLVFVNSRRRSEEVAGKLREHGFVADFNHAGLDEERRTVTQQDLRTGKLDVVVSTSSLEMGVNFPARKVIIFDAYGFDGESFCPMSVQRYLQCSGRAGRPGYDDSGVSVLLLPTWSREEDSYVTANPEPITSSLFATENLLKEVLNEVSSRLSISSDHLRENFVNRSLWRRQGGRETVTSAVDTLIEHGLLKEDKDAGGAIFRKLHLGGRLRKWQYHHKQSSS